MPVYRIGPALAFPPVDKAEDGLLAVGGDLSPERLLLAYRSGIFPWYDEDLPILWHSPDPRCVIPVDRVHVGRTLRRVIGAGTYEVRYDTAFERVIRACQKAPRPGQDGTWITEEMVRAYVTLYRMGYAHSVESWHDGELAGGLYGVSLGRVFFGESMFARAPNASKVALVHLAQRVACWEFPFVDAQVPTPHTVAMGAEEWPRATFIRALRVALAHPTRRGSWGEAEPPLETPAAG
jgi:leucyl/phenylalanyl-tRNA--protein transferase